jgi:hypothetical protein
MATGFIAARTGLRPEPFSLGVAFAGLGLGYGYGSGRHPGGAIFREHLEREVTPGAVARSVVPVSRQYLGADDVIGRLRLRPRGASSESASS